MLTDYIAAAMRHITCVQLPDDDTWYCEIPELPGVWSNATTFDAARAELQDVLEAWIALGLARHEAIPAMDGVEIAVQNM